MISNKLGIIDYNSKGEPTYIGPFDTHEELEAHAKQFASAGWKKLYCLNLKRDGLLSPSQHILAAKKKK